jgi:uncharacterized membrane protein YqhA
MNPIEQLFERLLWSSRLIVIVAVIASVVAGIGIFFISTVDVFQLIGKIAIYADPGMSDKAHDALRSGIIAHIVDSVDGYLLATVMLIFAMGLYELFIGKIDVVEKSELAERVLLIKNLDDLKDRLAKVVLLMLVVKFFQYALELKYENPLELLYLAIGILLVAGALYLSHTKSHAS